MSDPDRRFNKDYDYDFQSQDSTKTTTHYPESPTMTNNDPDIISHQPTPMHQPANNRDSISSSNSNLYAISSTAPWTYVPSGSIPLQRQDFHSSMKSLNLNGYNNNSSSTDIYNDNTDPITFTNTAFNADTNHTKNTTENGGRDFTDRRVSFFRDCLCVPCMMCDIAKTLGDKACLPFIPGTGAAIRFKVRILGGIQGTIADDCLVTSCCCPCAVCQMYREIDDIGLATR